MKVFKHFSKLHYSTKKADVDYLIASDVVNTKLHWLTGKFI